LHARHNAINLLNYQGFHMSSITVRNLPEETHRALRARAAMAGRSTEAEVRAILESIARPADRIKLGSLLAEIGQLAGGFDLEIERDKSPSAPMSFE
jgi:plasmid stability protein